MLRRSCFQVWRRPGAGSIARSAAGVLACLFLAGSGGGCAGLTAATIGTVAGVAASAVSTGTDLYRLGKLDTAEMSHFEETVEAVRQSAQDLSLRTTGRKDKEGSAEFAFADDKNASIKVRLDRRTQTLVRIRIDVGFLGSEVTARLFLARLRAHLPPSASPCPSPRCIPPNRKSHCATRRCLRPVRIYE